MSFITKILSIKTFDKGSSIGLGCSYITDRKSRIAVLPVGYADGYMRLFSNMGKVIVRGKTASVIGHVCMDMTFIDVTDIEGVAKGDDVILFGKCGEDFLPVEKAASIIGTINYELTCAVSKNVPRIYVE